MWASCRSQAKQGLNIPWILWDDLYAMYNNKTPTILAKVGLHAVLVRKLETWNQPAQKHWWLEANDIWIYML